MTNFQKLAQSEFDKLTIRQLAIMKALSEVGQIEHSPLAKIVGIEKGVLTRNIATLQSLLWVRRETLRDDGRRCLYSLTERGERAWERLMFLTMETD